VNGHRFHDTYQLRARNGDGSDKPKKKIKYDDFYSYVRDLKDVLSGVTSLNSQFTQLNTGISQLLKYIGKIDPPTADVIAKAVEAAVGGRLSTIEQRMDALSSRMEEILDHVERPEPAPEPEPEPSDPEPPPQVAPETAPPVEPVNDALPGMLMQAFQAEMGAPQQPTGDDHEALGVAFDLARAGSDDTTGAVRLFAVWLTSFRKLTIANDTMERSPATFAAQVVAGSLT
jgi:X-X-X-Leu-X-X-Gly heptad repeat protein